MELTPYTIVTVSAGIGRVKDYTWAALGFAIGVKNPLLSEIKKALENREVFDMGKGVLISTEGKVSKYHMN